MTAESEKTTPDPTCAVTVNPVTYAPAKYYVATYGDGGLEVQLFACPLEYGRAVQTAQRDHERGYNDTGDIDSYTNGDCKVARYDRGTQS